MRPTMRRPRGVLHELGQFLGAQAAALTSVMADWTVVWVGLRVGLHYLLAGVAGNLVGAITEFSLKRHVVFRATRQRSPWRQARRYILVSAGAAALNALTSYLVIGLLGAPKLPWIYITSTFGGLVWTYPMHRTYVFASPRR